MNTIWNPTFLSLSNPMNLLRRKIASMVDLLGKKPNWFSVIEISFRNLFSISLSHNFIVWLSNSIPLWLLQSWISPLFFYKGMTVLNLHSLGILTVLKIILKSSVSHFNHSSPKHFHTSIGSWSSPSTFPFVIFLRDSLISSSLIGSQKRGSNWPSLLSLSLLQKSSIILQFRSSEKYICHLCLILASSNSTLSFSSSIHLKTPKSPVLLSPTLCSLKTSSSPSLVSSFWYHLS